MGHTANSELISMTTAATTAMAYSESGPKMNEAYSRSWIKALYTSVRVHSNTHTCAHSVRVFALACISILGHRTASNLINPFRFGSNRTNSSYGHHLNHTNTQTHTECPFKKHATQAIRVANSLSSSMAAVYSLQLCKNIHSSSRFYHISGYARTIFA